MAESTARIERVVTHGSFWWDGQEFEVDNNVWLVGDDARVIVIDAAHSATEILAAIGGREVAAIICTHAHNDHVGAVPELRAATGAPVYLNPADGFLWEESVPERWDADLADGAVFPIAGVELRAIHTPGHTPGATCLYAEKLGTLFSGDTLFSGGPGATRFEYSDFGGIIDSITDKLLSLPDDTVVCTGHGDSTTIGTERPDRQAWIDRGY